MFTFHGINEGSLLVGESDFNSLIEYLAGRKDEAAKAVPDELVDDSAIVGDVDYVRKQIAAWEAAGVTMMVIGARSVEQIREAAALL